MRGIFKQAVYNIIENQYKLENYLKKLKLIIELNLYYLSRGRRSRNFINQ